MVTFSDLITLLLTFFVLLISMSSMDVKALQQAAGIFFSGGSGPGGFAAQGGVQDLGRFIESLENVPANLLLERQEEIKDKLFDFENTEYENLMDLVGRDIEIRKDERGLVFQLAESILFDEGETQIHYDFLPILSRLALVLRSARYQISIEGHSDDSLLEGESDAYAWELSLERAIAVMDYFTVQEGLRPDRFRVGGYGPSRPLGPNDTPEHRARNRRIEIVLYRDQFR
jgi:chemotaxis protein MotB